MCLACHACLLPLASTQVPRVLSVFLAARSRGDARIAASCCTADIECVGPLGSTRGLASAMETFFSKKWNSNAKTVVDLYPEPGSQAARGGGGINGGGGGGAVLRGKSGVGYGGESLRWRRKLIIDRSFGRSVKLEQRFTLLYLPADGLRIDRLEVIRK